MCVCVCGVCVCGVCVFFFFCFSLLCCCCCCCVCSSFVLEFSAYNCFLRFGFFPGLVLLSFSLLCFFKIDLFFLVYYNVHSTLANHGLDKTKTPASTYERKKVLPLLQLRHQALGQSTTKNQKAKQKPKNMRTISPR